MEIEFESVEIFRNQYRNIPGFVFGSGPSLKDININSLYNKGVIISCNSSIVELDYADFFIFTDGAVPFYNFYNDAIKKSKNIIFAGRGIDYKYYYNNINGYGEAIEHNNNKYLIDRRYDNRGRGFLNNDSDNAANFDFFDGKLIDGTDVCHVASHLSHILGCNPTYIIGVDLKWDGNERYFRSFSDDSILQRNNSPYRYMDNKSYFGDNNRDIFLNMSYNSWIKITRENKNLNIKCASKKSRLNDFFDYVDINKIF